MSARDGVVVVVGSGQERYRGYLVEAAARRSPLWLLDAAEPTWQQRHLEGAGCVDIFDPPALVAAVTALSRRVPVAGVLCYHEGAVLAAAHAAAALGLPGASASAVANCRDKSATRRLVAGTRVLQPRSALVSTPEEAARAAAHIGFPLVVKPRSLGASQGVVAVRSAAQLPAALETSRSAHQAGMPSFDDLLLEEYVEGPEISVDGMVWEGLYTPLFLAHKRLGLAPYFEETGHVVAADDPLLQGSAVRSALAAVHSALGVRHGITHTELKLTPAGPVLVEVNARLGGDLIPYLGMLATGIDAGAVAVDLATGRVPRPTASRRSCAGIRFLYPPRDAVLRSATLPPRGRGLVEAGLLEEPGALVRLPPGDYAARYGYLIAAAPDPVTCARRLDEAEAQACAEWDEAPPGLRHVS